jgi:hypothetical protein
MVDRSQSDSDESDPIDLQKEDVRLICDLIEGETRGRQESKGVHYFYATLNA